MIEDFDDSQTAKSNEWRAFLIGAAAFTAIAFLFATQRYVGSNAVGNQTSWRDAIIGALVVWWSWAALVPLMAWLARRVRISIERPASIAIHLLAAVGITVFHALMVATITPQFYYLPAIAPIRDMFRGRLASSLAFDLVIYFLMLAVIYLVGYARDTRRRQIASANLQAALAQTQLRALQAQLQPHFLFNTLNSIVALVHDDPDKATLMIRRLSELLRYCLTVSERSEVVLSEEIQFAKAYLEIQKIRFEDRLEYRFDVDDRSLHGVVPSFILQPLIENAVKFSLAEDEDVARIVVSGASRNGQLQISVADNGPGIRDETLAESKGVGIGTTRARLQQLYGDSVALSLVNAPEGGAVASVSMPYRTDET
ncbi:MAG: sensor histidine kinase [Gemmatimonadales bacterium]